MEKELNIQALPSVECRKLKDGTILYCVVHDGNRICVSIDYNRICTFLMGFYAALGYPATVSSLYMISLTDKKVYIDFDK